MRSSFLAILLALAFMGQSQQPSYYSIGPDVLEGTEVYDTHRLPMTSTGSPQTRGIR